MINLKTGSLAFIDSITGLVPCKVLSVEKRRVGVSMLHTVNITVRVTATRGAYTKGEITYGSERLIVPREAVYRRSHLRIRAYTVVCDTDDSNQKTIVL